MHGIYNPYDYYFNKAKQEWYKARSAFKLEEIQEKFRLIDKNTHKVLDIGCAPGSRMQYTHSLLQKLNVKDFSIIGFDLKESTVNLQNVHAYAQDITQTEKVEKILQDEKIVPYDPEIKWSWVDFIQSDMAPNTVGHKSVDAMRSVWLLEETLRIYKKYLKPNWRFAIKIFMWPGFQEFVADLKQTFGGKSIKVFKPKACRAISKETYIVKVSS